MLGSAVWMHYFNTSVTWYRPDLSIRCEYLMLRRVMCIFDGKREKLWEEWEQLLY